MFGRELSKNLRTVFAPEAKVPSVEIGSSDFTGDIHYIRIFASCPLNHASACLLRIDNFLAFAGAAWRFKFYAVAGFQRFT